MRRLPGNHPSRVPTWVSVLVICALVGVAVYRFRDGTLHTRHSMNHRSAKNLYQMAHAFAELNEAQARAATLETLAEPGVDGFHGRTYGFELHGSAPHWEGTRFVAYRDGEEAATLTVRSAVEKKWTTETEPIPEWWQVWK